MTNQSRDENIYGSSLSGSSGALNRTYSLTYSGLVAGTLDIHASGTFLHPLVDYTLSGSTVTFLNAIFNDQPIRLEYTTASGSNPSSSLRYATTHELAKELRIVHRVPSWNISETPSKEEVGTGDNIVTSFYLDHRNILAGTYTLYYGSAATTTTTLTETTHYALDKTTGAITLAAAGVTLVGTNKIYAVYQYVGEDYDLDDEYLESVLLRSERYVDGVLNTTFTDGSGDNPSYPSVVEIQDSKGWFDRVYQLEKRPLKDIVSALDGAVTSGASSLAVTAGDGVLFPLSGTIIVGNEIITYTGITGDTLTGLTRGVSDSDAATHASGDSVHTTVVEVSGTYEGSAPVWTTLSWDAEAYVDKDGFVQVYSSELLALDVLYPNLKRVAGVKQRTRFRYLYGFDEIPRDINRLTLIVAMRMLSSNTYRKSIVGGRDEFSPENFNPDDAEMQSIINTYRQLPMGNT